MAGLPTNDYIDQLAIEAEEGSDAALRELGKLAGKLGRQANQRMRRLEQAGKTGDAYQRIVEDLEGKKRFSQAKTGSAEGLRRNIEKALSALRRKESTISGIKEVDRKTVKSVFDTLHKTPPDGVTDRMVNDFNRFLENKAWPSIKRVFGSDALKQVADMVLNGDEIDDMLSEFTAWAETPEEERGSVFDLVEGYLEF